MTLNALFVYGTLKRGFSNHHRVAGAKSIQPAVAKGRLFALPYGYPAMVEGEGIVHGELCIFDDLSRHLSDLDAYEDCDPDDPERSLYRRVEVEVTVDGGERINAFTYVMTRAPEEGWPLPDGVWT